jgi:hypothetical protein
MEIYVTEQSSYCDVMCTKVLAKHCLCDVRKCVHENYEEVC